VRGRRIRWSRACIRAISRSHRFQLAACALSGSCGSLVPHQQQVWMRRTRSALSGQLASGTCVPCGAGFGWRLAHEMCQQCSCSSCWCRDDRPPITALHRARAARPPGPCRSQSQLGQRATDRSGMQTENFNAGGPEQAERVGRPKLVPAFTAEAVAGHPCVLAPSSFASSTSAWSAWPRSTRCTLPRGPRRPSQTGR
jgi:hypothetical protein